LLLACACTTVGRAPAEEVTVKEWPYWGGSLARNMVNPSTGISIDFEIESKKNILYAQKLGSQTYGNPVVAGGRIFVGANNGGEFLPYVKGDKGCLLCYDEKTGEFLWQLTRDKLPQGRVVDWPEQGICSTCFVEGERLWVVTNRAELMCLDVKGFTDGKNDGPYEKEELKGPKDGDVLWSFDMIAELGVFPHNLATSSPLVVGDLVFIVTSNGVDETHFALPKPDAPSFICLDKNTGKLKWAKNYPSQEPRKDLNHSILHGQWSSPTAGVVNGKTQIIFPAGDGAIYSVEPETGELVWKFQMNPVEATYELGGRGTRNECIATPVFYENSVIVAVGQDPEHGEGVGHLYRIDATKKGDISPEIGGEKGKPNSGQKPNPNNGTMWHVGGTVALPDGDKKHLFRRTISTVAIKDGLVYAADLSGYLKCVDFATGKEYWEADVKAAIWGSPMIVDGKVLLGDEEGKLTVFAHGKELKVLKEAEFGSAIYSTPTICNGNIYVTTRDKLFAIRAREAATK
jgi:outer membrane protein assembly factor BamB